MDTTVAWLEPADNRARNRVVSTGTTLDNWLSTMLTNQSNNLTIMRLLIHQACGPSHLTRASRPHRRRPLDVTSGGLIPWGGPVGGPSMSYRLFAPLWVHQPPHGVRTRQHGRTQY
jgi:hypothetical protein